MQPAFRRGADAGCPGGEFGVKRAARSGQPEKGAPVAEVLVQAEEDEEVVVAVEDAAHAAGRPAVPAPRVRGRQRLAACIALLLLRLVHAVHCVPNLPRQHLLCLHSHSALFACHVKREISTSAQSWIKRSA